LPINNREQIFKSNQKSRLGLSQNDGGQSGSFFFFSEDSQYIIKTVTKRERQVLIKNLNKLVHHFKEFRFSTCYLAKVVGIFEIKLQGFSPVGVLVMQNAVSKFQVGNKINLVFDIKGSRYKRQVLDKNSSKKKVKTANMVLKDLDFVNYVRNHDSDLINLKADDRLDLIKQLDADTSFLEVQGLMDYSLLLAIEEINQNQSDKSRNPKENDDAKTRRDSLQREFFDHMNDLARIRTETNNLELITKQSSALDSKLFHSSVGDHRFTVDSRYQNRGNSEKKSS
jgi:hypothetical protein